MKVNKLKFLMFAFFVAMIFAACSGDDGDPGPQGEPGLQGEKGDQGEKGESGSDSNSGMRKMGYFQGTVTGTRKDGTAFSEAFKYEYAADSIQGFQEEAGEKIIYISRNSNSFADSFMDMALKSPQDGVLEPASDSYSCEFSFFKELNDETLFRLYTQAYFVPTEAFVRELSLSQNEIYQFSQTGSEYKIYYSEASYNGNPAPEEAYRFDSYAYQNPIAIYYSVADGSLLGLYDWSEGIYIEDGDRFDLYNKIKFVNNAELDTKVFNDAATGEGLYESFPEVPADALTITNYTHDATTGIFTFDFVLTISGKITHYNRINSTGHDVTITGSYNSGGKVYKNIVSRQGS